MIKHNNHIPNTNLFPIRSVETGTGRSPIMNERICCNITSSGINGDMVLKKPSVPEQMQLLSKNSQVSLFMLEYMNKP